MIARQICERVLQKAVSTGADFAELFVENTLNHTIDMVDSLVDDVTDARIAGASVRVFKGLRSVSATTVDTSEAGLLRCAEQAASALGEGTAELDIRLNERLFNPCFQHSLSHGCFCGIHQPEQRTFSFFAPQRFGQLQISSCIEIQP